MLPKFSVLEVIAQKPIARKVAFFLNHRQIQELLSKKVLGLVADGEGGCIKSGSVSGIQLPPPSTSKL